MRSTQNNIPMQLFNRRLILDIIKACNELSQTVNNDADKAYYRYAGNTYPARCIAYLESAEANLATSPQEIVDTLDKFIVLLDTRTSRNFDVKSSRLLLEKITGAATELANNPTKLQQADITEDPTQAVLKAMHERHGIGIRKYTMEKLFPEIHTAIQAHPDDMTTYTHFMAARDAVLKYVKERESILDTSTDKSVQSRQILALRNELNDKLEPSLGNIGKCFNDDKFLDNKGKEVNYQILQAIVLYSQYVAFEKTQYATNLKTAVMSQQPLRTMTSIAPSSASSSSVSTTNLPSSTKAVSSPSRPTTAAPYHSTKHYSPTVFQQQPGSSSASTSLQAPEPAESKRTMEDLQEELETLQKEEKNLKQEHQENESKWNIASKKLIDNKKEYRKLFVDTNKENLPEASEYRTTKIDPLRNEARAYSKKSIDIDVKQKKNAEEIKDIENQIEHLAVSSIEPSSSSMPQHGSSTQ